MSKAFLLATLIGLGLVGPMAAEERVTLGWGRLFTNDALGDGEDRWRTGSYSISLVQGPRWAGDLPQVPGEILEYRIGASILAPANLDAPDPSDRRYAGAITAGVATHFERAGFETMLGGGVTMIGPSTGLSTFQESVHDLFGLPAPAAAEDELPDQLHPWIAAETARVLPLSPSLALRPFLAAEVGAEDLARIGGDVILGRFGRTDLLLRDATTGLLYPGVRGTPGAQTSLILGADTAKVFDSAFLPEGGSAVASDRRDRLRVGLAWQGQRGALFAGLAWLGPEFEAQSEGQVLGALNLSFDF